MSKEDYYKYVVLDLETSGLDPNVDEILELGAIIVDSELNEIARYSSVVAPDVQSLALQYMSDFVRDMHTKNGLLDNIKALRSSQNESDLPSVELEFIQFLAKNNCKPGEIVLIGKNVGRFDRKFIKQNMPALEWVLSHRCIELGDVVRFMNEFCGVDVTAEKKESNHRAIDDCDLALEEARALRDQIKNMKDTYAVQAMRAGTPYADQLSGAEPVQMTSVEATEKFGRIIPPGLKLEDAYPAPRHECTNSYGGCHECL